MANIIIAMARPEECTSIRNLLARSGYRNSVVCSSGAQAIAKMDELEEGVIISAYKLVDMMYSRILDNKPDRFDMLILASQKNIQECYGTEAICLAMPIKVDKLIETVNSIFDEQARRRRRARLMPKKRSDEELGILSEAKKLLMEKNNMDEAQAHRYLQKNSMDSGNDIVEMARMVISLMKDKS